MDVPPVAVAIDNLVVAISSHDPARVAACFADDYRNETPVHPSRSFQGRGQVERNWTVILGAVPDLKAELLSLVTDGQRAWCEWEWTGTRRDGTPHLMRGVTITDVRDGVITAARFYMEPVENDGVRIDDAVRATLRLENVGEAAAR